MFRTKKPAAQLSEFLTEYAKTKDIYMRINYVNADHAHVLVDLPTNLAIENLEQPLKGSGSTAKV
jgi:REP-associated tyrosine transposase